ncbi:MAG: cation:proton antiporter [Leptolyngbyaceae cyanobacterium]
METHELPNIFVLGLFLMFGGSAYTLAPALRLPRATLLVVAGIIVGPSVLDWVPEAIVELFPTISYISLSMIAFRVGEAFVNFDLLKEGPRVFAISLSKTVISAGLVFAIAYLIQGDLILAMLLAGLAPASAPSATLDVISETKAKGPLTDTIVRVLALDNVLGVILFTVLLIAAETLTGQGEIQGEVVKGAWEIGGAMVLGLAIGWLMARLTGRLRAGKVSLLQITGFVFLCAGLAYQIHVSYLLACIFLGATVAKNRAQPKKNIFATVEDISEPFLVIFFLLAGCELDLMAVQTLGLIGVAYVLARCLGFVIGGGLASRLIGAAAPVQKHIGWSLFPQAGVALGLAVVTLERFPEIGEVLVSVIVSTTVIFELFGPTVTRWRLSQAQETEQTKPDTQSNDLPFVQVSK